MRNSLVLPIIILALAIAGYLLFFKPINSSPDFDLIQPASTDQFIQGSPDTSGLAIGGSSYLDPKGVYSFLYPNNYTLDMQNDGQYTRIFMHGLTQQGQTEIYDGVLMVFEGVELGDKPLEEFVDERIQEGEANGTSPVVEDKKAVLLGEHPGFTYKTGGFGSATYLVVQKDPESNYAVSISFSINDPENIGYETDVEAVLSTLQLMK